MTENQAAGVLGATMSPAGGDLTRRIAESRTDAFQLFDAGWHLTYMNPVAKQFFARHGMNPDDMLGRHLWDELFPEARNGDAAPHMFRAMGERVPVAFESYYAPWDTWLFSQFDPLPDGGLANYYADISVEKRTADRLRQSEALLAEAQQLAQVGSWNFDLASDTVQWSDEQYRLFGLHPQEMVMTYDRVVQLVHPDDHELIRAVTAQALRDHQPFEYNFRVVPIAGLERVLCSRGQVVLDEYGVPERMFGTLQDVTKRVAAEHAQRALQRERDELLKRLQLQFAQMPIACVISDPQMRIMDWNPAAELTFGYRRDEVVGRDGAPLLVPPNARAQVTEIFRQVAHGHAPVSVHENLTKDGRIITCEWRNSPLRDADGNVVASLAMAQDITERKRYQDQLEGQEEWLERLVTERTNELERTTERLRRSERMASLGTLAAGLGHDVGNLLLPLEVRLSLLDQAELGDEVSEHVDGIRKCVDYLRRLSNGLQLLSLDPEIARGSEPTDLAAWWNDVSPIIKNVLPHDIRFSHGFPPETCWITISPVALTQSIFNLVQNAVDAMRRRGFGHVTVSAICDHDASSVVLEVIDDGPGMPAEVVSRCMEPYFSTKTRGITTGMGLSMAYGMVEAAGGRVEIESALEQGTTVRLRLPMATPAEAFSDVRWLPNSSGDPHVHLG
jgi:PAS domain S-box-containing protein